jgi:hypothetical protein
MAPEATCRSEFRSMDWIDVPIWAAVSASRTWADSVLRRELSASPRAVVKLAVTLLDGR